MFGTLGFSCTGLIFLCCLFVPNIIYAKNQPSDRFTIVENAVLVAFERIGQALAFVSVLIFDDLNVHAIDLRTAWLGGALVLTVLYILCWLRYFTGERVSADIYRPFLRIPLPLAVLPVAAVLLLAVYGRVVWIGIAGVILGIGHIGVTAQNWKAVRQSQKTTGG